jgi:hypothetical protein
MSQSQIQQTQAYNAYPSSISAETPAPARVIQPSTSPIAEQDEDESDTEGNGHEAPLGQTKGSTSSSMVDGANGEEDDDDEDDENQSREDDDDETTTTIPTPRIYPVLPRTTASQPTPAFPGLSTLPREILRQGKSFTSSQPVKAKTSSLLSNGHGKEEDSSSESSESEAEGDKALKGRYANGRSGRKKVTNVKRSW